jgi:hypothetical protein
MKQYAKVTGVLLICAILVIGASVSFNHDNNPPIVKNVIGTYFEPALVQFSPDFSKIAFAPSQRYYDQGRERTSFAVTTAYVYDIQTQKIIEFLENTHISGLSWKKGSKNPSLWISKWDPAFGFWPRYFLYEIHFDRNEFFPEVIQTHKNPKIVSSFSWNHSGSILVGRPRKDYTASRDALHGNIAASYDNGRSAIYYKGVRPKRVIWENDEIFYTVDNQDQKILKFQMSSGNLVNTGVVHEGEKVALYGLIDGKCIYRSEDIHIYWGNNLLYTTKNPIGSGRAADSFVVFRENNEVVALGISGGVINKRTLKSDFTILDIDANENNVYLLSERNCIVAWNFKDNGEIKHVLEIGIILGSDRYKGENETGADTLSDQPKD